jgi:hypothetical protein
LQDVHKNAELRDDFEYYLNEKFSLSMWMFWVDLTNIVDNKMSSKILFGLSKYICKKFFFEDSPNEVIF